MACSSVSQQPAIYLARIPSQTARSSIGSTVNDCIGTEMCMCMYSSLSLVFSNSTRYGTWQSQWTFPFLDMFQHFTIPYGWALFCLRRMCSKSCLSYSCQVCGGKKYFPTSSSQELVEFSDPLHHLIWLLIFLSHGGCQVRSVHGGKMLQNWRVRAHKRSFREEWIEFEYRRDVCRATRGEHVQLLNVVVTKHSYVQKFEICYYTS